MVPTRDSETVPEWIDYASTEKKVPNFGIADIRRKPIRACTTTLNALGILHRPLGNSLGMCSQTLPDPALEGRRVLRAA
jgi:hypothetical protein